MASSQFQPMALQPDIAFNDFNDRFDLTGVYAQERQLHGGDDDDEEDSRRYLRSDIAPLAPQYRRLYPSRSYVPSYSPYRRSGSPNGQSGRRNDWLYDMIDYHDAMDQDDTAYLKELESRRHSSRTHRRAEERKKLKKKLLDEGILAVGARAGPTQDEGDRQIVLQYPLRVRLNLRDSVNGTGPPTITGIRLL